MTAHFRNVMKDKGWGNSNPDEGRFKEHNHVLELMLALILGHSADTRRTTLECTGRREDGHDQVSARFTEAC